MIFFLFLVLYYFKERRKESQLFSVNFMKNMNDFGIGLFFCLEIKFRVNLGMFLGFYITCKKIQAFSKIQ